MRCPRRASAEKRRAAALSKSVDIGRICCLQCVAGKGLACMRSSSPLSSCTRLRSLVMPARTFSTLFSRATGSLLSSMAVPLGRPSRSQASIACSGRGDAWRSCLASRRGPLNVWPRRRADRVLWRQLRGIVCASRMPCLAFVDLSYRWCRCAGATGSPAMAQVAVRIPALRAL